jgi:hypothetical protein
MCAGVRPGRALDVLHDDRRRSDHFGPDFVQKEKAEIIEILQKEKGTAPPEHGDNQNEKYYITRNDKKSKGSEELLVQNPLDDTCSCGILERGWGQLEHGKFQACLLLDCQVHIMFLPVSAACVRQGRQPLETPPSCVIIRSLLIQFVGRHT